MPTDENPSATSTETKAPPATGTNVVALPARPEKARPSDKVVAFVKEHPVLTVAGGIAVGLAVSALLPRKGSRKLAKRAFGLAEVAGSAALTLGRNFTEKAEEAGSKAGKRAGILSHQAEKFGESAADKVSHLGHAAMEQAGRFGSGAAKRAGELGEAALAQSTKMFGYPKPPALTFSERLAEKAGELRERIRR